MNLHNYPVVSRTIRADEDTPSTGSAPVSQLHTVILSRVLLFVAAICIGFAIWTIHTHPTAQYRTPVGDTIATTISSETCSSVWDRWIDHLPPAPTSEPPNIENVVGPTIQQLKASACSASIVGHEHISETWAAAALASLLAGAFAWWRIEN